MLFGSRRKNAAVAVEKVMYRTDREAAAGNWVLVSQLAGQQDRRLLQAIEAGWVEDELMEWLRQRNRISKRWFSVDESYADWLCNECMKRGLTPGI